MYFSSRGSLVRFLAFGSSQEAFFTWARLFKNAHMGVRELCPASLGQTPFRLEASLRSIVLQGFLKAAHVSTHEGMVDSRFRAELAYDTAQTIRP